MANPREIVLATGEIYHVFNRGIDRRPIFKSSNDYHRAKNTVDYYRFVNPPIRYSFYLNLNPKRKQQILNTLTQIQVTILGFCLMPNHFHFILKQEKDNGISRFVSNLTNSYSKYFNTKYQRAGPLFQGTFKAVRVETEEQLIHLSRYVHLNPVSSSLIPDSKLENYPWSSYPEYISPLNGHISETSDVLSNFKNREEYQIFVRNQIDYAKKLESIKHLSIDEYDQV